MRLEHYERHDRRRAEVWKWQCCWNAVGKRRYLETVNLDLVLGRDTLLDDESGDLLTLITLELDDLTEILVVNNSAVACELLLERL